ncbi:hypothetical protein NDU88_004246 [Pleurodeles waltl]|uniref:Uncharacterized protein n=1 Tax=Pleurodeles waltl TaxID=8319 RepID=A0AAV7UGK9_PLEWA|nr:hypothetical protein NDU88_004246 [Pleurodeles waltl]
MAESRWISPSSIHTSLCLVASRLLPRPTKGPRVLQRGTGGPRSACASCPLSPRSVLRPLSRWGGVPEAKRLRGQAAIYRLWGAPSLLAIAALAALIFWSEQRSGASQCDRAAGMGASSVPRIGREPSAPGSSFYAPLATASVLLVPRQGGMVLDPQRVKASLFRNFIVGQVGAAIYASDPVAILDTPPWSYIFNGFKHYVIYINN